MQCTPSSRPSTQPSCCLSCVHCHDVTGAAPLTVVFRWEHRACTPTCSPLQSMLWMAPFFSFHDASRLQQLAASIELFLALLLQVQQAAKQGAAKVDFVVKRCVYKNLRACRAEVKSMKW